MKYTIVMPAYNAEKDIRRAIYSVIMQHHSNFRLIIVNDGSIDKTGSIIDEFATDPRIEVIHQKNTGIAGAYDSAFERLDGDYILFLDSDDYLSDMALSDIETQLKTESVDIVQFGIAYYDEDWNYQRSLIYNEERRDGNKAILLAYLAGLNDGSDRPNLGIRAYKRSLFDNFEFSSGSLGIDEILNLYAMTRCSSIRFLQKVYYNCQRRVNSVSRQYPTVEKIIGQLKSFERMELILSKENWDCVDVLSIKFLKHYINYSEIIMSIPEYKVCRMKAKEYLRHIRNSARVKISLSVKVRVLLFIHLPPVLKLVNRFRTLVHTA